MVNSLSRPVRALRRAVMAQSRRSRDQGGLTLIEVLVSVVVLGIVIAPMFDAFVRGRVMVQHRAEERVALRLVERKTEQLLAAGGAADGDDSNITSTNMTDGSHPSNSAITLITRGDADTSNDVIGDLSWAVSTETWTDPAGSWEDATYKRVTVKLAWPLGAHRDSVQISTIVR
jgi:prepilin-type N-terminal cleavage/methylation domain-containing protein